MIEVRQTIEFSDWLRRLKDVNAVARIVARIRRVELGNPGDARSVGSGVMEMRIAHGPGYRVYYVHRGTRDRDPAVRRRQAYATARYQAGASSSGETVMPRTTRFDAADYLDNEERQAAYITAALETGDANFVRDALGIVARARGMGEIARNAGLNRESLYKALGETGNPEFSTVMRIVRAMGLTLSARSAETKRTTKKRRVA
jgi:probable addiction module antidote protein/putative addiction module killer protein